MPRRSPLPILWALLLPLSNQQANAQEETPTPDDSIAVTVQGSDWHRVNAGSALTASFRIRNLSQREYTVRAVVDHPEGWTSMFPVDDIVLEAGAFRTKFVLLRIPDDVPPGKYPLGLAVTSSRGDRHSAQSVVEVTSRCSFQIDARPVSRYVEAGQVLFAHGVVRNDGNVDLLVSLSARSSRGYEVAIDSSALFVPAGREVEFGASVRTSRDASTREMRGLIITASATDCRSFTDDVAVLFDVIPTTASSVDELPIPGALIVNSTASGRALGAQVGIELAGYLDAKRSKRMGLTLQLPDQRKVSRFGRRGLVNASFESRSVGVSVGDARFGYSELTRVPGIGRGISLEFRRGPLTAGAFADRSRLGFPVRRREGVLLSFETSSWSSMGATYLRREGVDRGESVTLFASAHPSELAKMSLEVGDAVTGAGRTGAAAIEMTGRRNQWIQYSGRIVQAGSGFPGQYADFRFRHGSLTVRPVGGLSVYSSVKVERQSFGGPKSSGGWYREDRYMRAGAGFRVGKDVRATTLRLDFGNRDRSTVSESLFGLRERETRISLESRNGSLAASTYVTLGRFEASGTQPAGGYRQFGISAEGRFGGHAVGTSFEHFEGLNIEHPVRGTSSSVRLAYSSQLGGLTRLQVDGFVSQDDFWGGWYQLLHARLTRRFGRSELTARLQYTSAGSTFGQSATDVGLSLKVPLSVPNPFHSPATRVSGRVVNSVTGEPVAGVLVHMSDSHALTGRDGQFHLRDHESGSHLLNMDVSTLAVDLVPMVELPIHLAGESEHSGQLVLPVAPAARFSGRFLMVEKHGKLEAGPVTTVRPVPLAVIEIVDDAGSYRTVTNAAGRFIFPKIRPGEYRASVVVADLPRRYRVEKDSYAFRVVPGGEATLEILAVAGSGNIQIISAGELSVSTDPVTEREPERPTSVSEPISECVLADWAKAEQTHRVAAGESLSLIAQSYLGEALLWPVLWIRNQDQVSNPHRIPVGLDIQIPARRFTSRSNEDGWSAYRYEIEDSPEHLANEFFGLRELWPLLVPSGRDRVPAREITPATRLTVPDLRVDELPAEVCTQSP